MLQSHFRVVRVCCLLLKFSCHPNSLYAPINRNLSKDGFTLSLQVLEADRVCHICRVTARMWTHPTC
jgi:hypothetical protein